MTKAEGEQEESRNFNKYWMEDAQLLSTAVMAVEDAAKFIQMLACQMDVDWIVGTKGKTILADLSVLEDDTKDDALYRLLDAIVKVARETDPGNSKILVFANTLTLGRKVTGKVQMSVLQSQRQCNWWTFHMVSLENVGIFRLFAWL